VPEVNEYGQLVGDVVPEWSPRPRPDAVTLEGRYVVVEPLAVSHAVALLASTCGPDDRPLWTYRATEPPAGLEEMTDLIARTLATPDLLTFALCPEGRAAEGIASYTRLDPATGQVEVAGVLFARTMQRTRAATEAIHLLMRYAFDDLGYRRFEWKCDSLNQPSRRAAVRLGFHYEGRFRHHMVTKGRNRDTDWFSVTEAEWPTVRAAHEAWLDPGNFDAGGRQRTPLSAAQAGPEVAAVIESGDVLLATPREGPPPS
jgi:RimJ/RimL family protein N-acetyltransferase